MVFKLFVTKAMFENVEPREDLQSELQSLAAEIDTPVPAAPRKGQRRHVRITMTRAKACIQCPNAGEEFVELVDISKGGASFRSQKVYSLGSWVRIAAPCTVGGGNIFVLARVVRAKRATVGREYGVEYVNTSR